MHLHRHSSFEGFDQTQGGTFLAGASLNGTTNLDALPLERPVCFLFGNEKEGLSKEAQKRCDLLFRLPMFGMVESYNLSVAAALTLYDFLKRKRAHLHKNGDLTLEEIMKEKARCYIRSLGIELSHTLLKRSFHSTI